VGRNVELQKEREKKLFTGLGIRKRCEGLDVKPTPNQGFGTLVADFRGKSDLADLWWGKIKQPPVLREIQTKKMRKGEGTSNYKTRPRKKNGDGMGKATQMMGKGEKRGADFATWGQKGCSYNDS